MNNHTTVYAPTQPSPDYSPEASTLAPVATSEQPSPAKNPQPQNSENNPFAHTKPKRTPGLWITDNAIYGVVNNSVVFAISVAATYMTAKGGERTPEGKLIYGKVGEWFQKRGDTLKNYLMKPNFVFRKGLSENAANMAKMVGFSFADGTAVAPFVKLLEDRREDMAQWFDDKLGTKPENEAEAYEAEPKQSWASVVSGRLATAGVVVPVAATLEKTHLSDGRNVNQHMFEGTGTKFGEWMASKEGIVNFFKKLRVPQANLPELGKTMVFEAFYTSVCTAGLYLTSRGIARFFNRRADEKAERTQQPIPFEDVQTQKTSPEASASVPAVTSSPESPQEEAPQARHLSHIHHQGPLQHAPAMDAALA